MLLMCIGQQLMLLLRCMQDECWAGVPFDPKPHVSRLEAVVGAAR
jgi:hypothetical protein